MLTLESLAERLSAFSVDYLSRSPEQKNSPIVLYQSLFGFLHNLKSSIHLSEESNIISLLEIVLESEAVLRRLAQDEIELPADQNAALHKLASHLDSVESLALFLKTVASKTLEVTPTLLSVYSSPYPWESLSRARASSAIRHGYRFYVRTTRETLDKLTAYDEKTRVELAPIGGIDVVRSLQPKPRSEPSSAATLFLEINHLAAIMPSAEQAMVSCGWRSFGQE